MKLFQKDNLTLMAMRIAYKGIAIYFQKMHRTCSTFKGRHRFSISICLMESKNQIQKKKAAQYSRLQTSGEEYNEPDDQEKCGKGYFAILRPKMPQILKISGRSVLNEIIQKQDLRGWTEKTTDQTSKSAQTSNCLNHRFNNKVY